MATTVAWYIFVWPILFMMLGAAGAGLYALFMFFFGKD